MSRLIAVVERGTWSTVEVPEPSRAVEPIVKEVEVPMVPRSYEDCVAALASVVAASSRLSFNDQMRIRDTTHAVSSLLSAQCRIEDSADRRRFEQELHRALATRSDDA